MVYSIFYWDLVTHLARILYSFNCFGYDTLLPFVVFLIFGHGVHDI